MFITHINVINKVSEFYNQQVARGRMKGKSKGSDEVSLSLNKCSINNSSYDAGY